MKNVNIRLLSLLFVLFLACTTAFSQKEPTTKVVIIQKIENADGTTTTVKKVISGKKGLKAILKEVNETEGENMDLHIISEDQNAAVTEEDMIVYIREARDKNDALNKDMKEFKIFMSGKLENLNFDNDFFISEKEKITKPLLGVYVDESRNGDGVKLTGVVSGKGAEVAGLKSEDIVNSINGNPVSNVYDLRNELNKFKAGDSVKVSYTRAGQPAQTQVVLSESTSWRTKRNPCKVFIGVQLGGQNFEGRGVNVDGIISDWPAAKAGVLAGDIILALDDVEVNNFKELLTERNKHNAGEYFTLSIYRDGQELDIEAQFKACEEDEPEEIIEEEIPVEIDNGTGENNSNTSLQLETYAAFPNPTYGKVRIQFRAEEGPTTIRIVDVTGKILFKEYMWHFDGYYNKEIDLNEGTPGTVVIHITKDEKTISKKIILMPRA